MATRDAILKAAKTHDIDALEALIDPDRFGYRRGGAVPAGGARLDAAGGGAGT